MAKYPKGIIYNSTIFCLLLLSCAKYNSQIRSYPDPVVVVADKLTELAALMKEMGCVGALNLDGGGSASLVVNGKATVKSSDGAELGVITAVMIKVNSNNRVI